MGRLDRSEDTPAWFDGGGWPMLLTLWGEA